MTSICTGSIRQKSIKAHQQDLQQPEFPDHEDTKASDIPSPDRLSAKHSLQNSTSAHPVITHRNTRATYFTGYTDVNSNKYHTSNIAQPVIVGYNEPISSKSSASQSHIKQDVLYDFDRHKHDLDRRKSVPNFRKLLHRPLGGLEIMYHHTVSKGMDMIYLMTKISTSFPVTPSLTKKALLILAKKHPLLRMTIQHRTNSQSSAMIFREMDTLAIDFKASDREDWLTYIMEEISMPFDIQNGPLWKFRLLFPASNSDKKSKSHSSISNQTVEDSHGVYLKDHNTSHSLDEFAYVSTIFFIIHHSIMDGSYVCCLFSELAELLNELYIMDTHNIYRITPSPLMPPIEEALLYPAPRRQMPKSSESSSSVCLQFSDPSYEMIHDYDRKYLLHIEQNDCIVPRNRCEIFEFSENETAYIANSCKEFGSTTTGGFLTSGLLAFIDLLHTYSNRKPVQVPFECMIDLRRHFPLAISNKVVKFYPGAASMHVPFLASLNLSNKPVTKEEFWRLSQAIGSETLLQLRSVDTMHWIQQFIQENNEPISSPKSTKPQGKSPFVLCFSHMGCLDNVLTGHIRQSVRLDEIHGHSTVLNEDSPIFYVGNYSLNGRICLNVSFCESYTSVETAKEYVANIRKLLLC